MNGSAKSSGSVPESSSSLYSSGSGPSGGGGGGDSSSGSQSSQSSALAIFVSATAYIEDDLMYVEITNETGVDDSMISIAVEGGIPVTVVEGLPFAINDGQVLTFTVDADATDIRGLGFTLSFTTSADAAGTFPVG